MVLNAVFCVLFGFFPREEREGREFTVVIATVNVNSVPYPCIDFYIYIYMYKYISKGHLY